VRERHSAVAEAGEETKPEVASSAGTQRIGWRQVLLLGVLSVVLALAMNWPLLMKLNRALPNSPFNLALYSQHAPGGFFGDPLFEAWEIAWDGHALIHQPGHFFDANILWPFPHTLAFADGLLGYAPAGILGSGTKAAIVRYDVIYLFTFALAFAGATLLARELDVGWGAAGVCGAAFAFNGWRLAQASHLQVLSSGGIPLSLWFLLRGWRTRRPWLVLTGWVVAAWQVSLGFTLGVPFAYLLASLTTAQVVLWFLHHRPAVGRRMVIASAAGIAIFGTWAVLQALPYLRVLHDFPDARRSQRQATAYSPPAIGYLAAPDSSVAWGRVTERVRDRLIANEEQTLFPGATVALLALWAIVLSARRRALRFGLFTAAVVFGVLSLGLGTLQGRLGYRYLWLHAPGWSSSRTPGRLVTFVLLSLALLAAIAAQGLVERLLHSVPAIRERFAHSVVPGFLIALVLFEGAGRLEYPVIPVAPAGISQAASPSFHLPSNDAFDNIYEFWSTNGFPHIVNGQTAFVPCLLPHLRELMTSFPDQRSILALRSIGVNSVVLHLEFAAGTPWAGLADRPVDGLSIQRQVIGRLIVYALGDRRAVRPPVIPVRCSQ
jgi:hypothetical protein